MNVSDINTIAVVGAGLMGHGIAQEFATAGYEVQLTSRSQASLDRAASQISDNLTRLVSWQMIDKNQIEAIQKRLWISTDLDVAVREADFVVEAVYEDLTIKRDLFQQIDSICQDHTILTSTTSTFTPTQLFSSSIRPDRTLITHYINPPYLVPLVELVPSKQTSRETLDVIEKLLRSIGKRPAILTKEIPGFISVRLQSALLREALSLIENGAATAADIDIVIKTSLGRRWAVAGIFEVLDLAGWDVVSNISRWLFPKLESSGTLPTSLSRKIERKEFGVKSGKGFYQWTPDSAEQLRQRIGKALIEIQKWD